MSATARLTERLPFSPTITLATAVRVLQQIARDRGSTALLLGIPCMLMLLLKLMFDDAEATFERVGPRVFGIFPVIVMYLVASVSTLRERTSGTAERLLTMPVRRLDLILGYSLAFALLALLQAVLSTLLSIGPLGLDIEGPPYLLMIIAMLGALLGLALGLLVSAFARNEFQAVQFLPAGVLPQFLVCGLFVPREDMQGALAAAAKLMPMTYAVQAAGEAADHSGVTGIFIRDAFLILLCVVLVLIAAATTLKR
ncbi:Inner membrane transport permease YbhS [Streptomyces netropsis]|uniref:Transport permease protein n=1 Tax=Streptomyces syringium TaxID=76729 RepID=A0ABS4Y7G7_9ACTN|nr:ABC transporter permease [Streptomyces syringium]MBP2404595.1 ABC-2 type transport system permease protein [Streptomyces syringium]SPE57538.1 Inner membrane transport permease YbhS [Streptomyces netropsis]